MARGPCLMSDILWLRSFPARPPLGRAHVQDEMPRHTMADYDYSGLADYGKDICLLEWDMALEPADMPLFEMLARAHPREVLVAPYLLYNQGDRPVYAHRVIDERRGPDYHARTRWLHGGEIQCDYFGFGLVYLPHALIRAFLDAPAPERGRPPDALSYSDMRLTDQTFSVWHRHRGPGTRPRVAWEVRPVHLHGGPNIENSHFHPLTFD